MKKAREKNYKPHKGQLAFHYACEVARYIAMIVGIRGGKTFAGARQAHKIAWNYKEKGDFGIIAPTYHMLERTTWQEYKEAAEPWIRKEDKSKKIITLKNGERVLGFSAENPDRIRNTTLKGAWVDEARECKDFYRLWDVLLGRVLSTNGKIFVTSSPNGYDDLHTVFVDEAKPEYKYLKFATYENIYIPKSAIDDLAGKYDEKYAQQEIYGEFVVFEGQVYYTFNRHKNAGDIAFKKAQYDPDKPIRLCCDFNVDPMAWEICQIGINEHGEKEVYWVDEIYLRNSNTVECCEEFKRRYAERHRSGLYLYGDATGKNRSTNSNRTNWSIIKTELQRFNPIAKVPTSNPAERDRINCVNAMIRNSKDEIKTFVNPKKCKKLVQDFEQVPYKEGKVAIDKSKRDLTHASDAAGYMYSKEFSIEKNEIRGLKI